MREKIPSAPVNDHMDGVNRIIRYPGMILGLHIINILCIYG